NCIAYNREENILKRINKDIRKDDRVPIQPTKKQKINSNDSVINNNKPLDSHDRIQPTRIRRRTSTTIENRMETHSDSRPISVHITNKSTEDQSVNTDRSKPKVPILPPSP